jgi:hypothetical protein
LIRTIGQLDNIHFHSGKHNYREKNGASGVDRNAGTITAASNMNWLLSAMVIKQVTKLKALQAQTHDACHLYVVRVVMKYVKVLMLAMLVGDEKASEI